ncbi:hypothetical protein FOL47_009872 [Perkinsus chesapeaki]|uniref:Methyltransferase FkbM domain-containing protein n=1 Tax=Perkinsus chesapeaki TaxID=330153 RepID=A0A7J6L5Z9_PERCH|nr:hypothetical protein FOL47_009872 [Perkinsus chesapeaki]
MTVKPSVLLLFGITAAYTETEATAYLSAISLEGLRDGFTLDIEDLVPPFKALYKGPRKSGIFLDIGAHMGKSTSTMLDNLESVVESLPYKAFLPLEPVATTVVIAFEAIPWLCEMLKRKSILFGWKLLQPLHVECAAVSNVTGETTFYFKSPYGQTASMLPRRDNIPKLQSIAVSTTRLVDNLRELEYTALPVFLMKVDTEGMDGLIVESALSDGIKPSIIIFEYSRMWNEPSVNIHLGHFASRLQRLYGYYCFAATRLGIWVPLWGRWYTDIVDGVYSYGNVVCLVCSPEFGHLLSQQITDPAARVFVVNDFLEKCGLETRDPESLYTELDHIYWGALNDTASLEWHMASLATYRSDFASAFKWSESAAARGQFDAEFLVGLHNYFGLNRRGVGNRQKGIYWLNRAASKGHGGAAWFLNRMRWWLRSAPQPPLLLI